MRFLLVLLAIPALVLAQEHAAPGKASDKIDPATEQEIRKLIDLFGLKAAILRNVDASVDRSLDGLRANPNLTPEFINEFGRRFRQRLNVDAYLDVAVKAYGHHFTADEIKQIIAFHNSPVGRKLTAETPAVQKEIIAGTQQLGASLANQVGNEIAKEHPEYIKNQPPAKK